MSGFGNAVIGATRVTPGHTTVDAALRYRRGQREAALALEPLRQVLLRDLLRGGRLHPERSARGPGDADHPVLMIPARRGLRSCVGPDSPVA